MEISRHASKSNHGEQQTSAQIDALYVRDDHIEIHSKAVREFRSSDPTKHDYTFKLSFEEFREVVSVISEQAAKRPSAFEEAVSPILKDLLVLQTVGSGSYKIPKISKD
ncbi:hypothetical protein [Thalassospira sp. HJ]|uniref:hypothetical protein n=1 Tax=Thalassospira sp. HJ TaxID=1616823 RepID=UPI00126A67FE|nr:hypothetical protein [Thalassospira sp. HJ]